MSYAISGGHQKTIEAAEIILQKGGNAVDAAIAAYLVSFISEPCMASLGAGGFAKLGRVVAGRAGHAGVQFARPDGADGVDDVLDASLFEAERGRALR